jgi:ceramide glucosyltransferase
MIPYLPMAANALLLAAILMGLAYLLVAIRAVRAFPERRAVASPLHPPPVTILKPVCGDEHGLYENLRSFCDQDYPSFQVVFGVRGDGDPAIPVVERLIREFPGLDTVLAVDDRVTGGNPKVASLANMYPHARHDYLVIADSDMRVDRTYLRSVTASFGDPRVGATTCLYSGTPAAGWPSNLGAMYVNDWFLPSVLVALTFQKLSFCFGASMAVRRDALAAIGGFEALAPYLADDYMLGDLISRRGYQIRLSSYVVEGIIFEPDFRSLLAHELRWARTIRACRPAGYAFSFVGNGTITLSALFLLASGLVGTGAALLFLSIALRVALHYSVRSAVRVQGPAAPWLVPLRDLLCLVIWGASFFGREVRWRGRRFSVRPDGQLITEREREIREDPVS